MIAIQLQPNTWSQRDTLEELNSEPTYNLWQVEGVITDGVEDKILELVDRPQKVVSEGRHR